MKEQQNNKSSNRILSYKNEEKTMQEWSDILGISKHTLYRRLKKGWSTDKAFTRIVTPNGVLPKIKSDD